MTAVLPASDDQARLAADLRAAGLLIESGVPGIVGQGPVFVDVREAVDAAITRAAAPQSPVRMSFPAVLPRRRLEATGYLRSFPHLAATVWAFDGSPAQADDLAERAEDGRPWDDLQSCTDLALVPAACHPVYPAVAAGPPLPAGGVMVDAGAAAVFRSEPSHDPSRLQAFSQRELVRIGEAQVVRDWRDTWRDRAAGLLSSFGLPVQVEQAADPFFGRSGRMLAANQRSQALKFELLVQVAGPTPTALASFNYHRDHFTGVYGLALASGEPVHTACLGFGLERVCVALFAVHGTDPGGWPAQVRQALWP